ncbi:26S proteasome subunit RPN7-domain-containing protein [Syncephalis plumigaleata]|nr:26S proteasome subunit RPN7-domain-containing protein [Syncephalis plumigaleata]
MERSHTDGGDSKRKRIAKMVDTPQHLVLENYAENYQGHVKIERLVFIAERCPNLQVDAYRLALAEIKANTLDAKRYKQLIVKLNAALESHGQAPMEFDAQWVEQTETKVKRRFDELEADLKGYRSNLIKESIRIGLHELADHHYAYGDLTNALKNYSRAREYCSTAAQTIENCLSIIRISHEINNMSHIASQVSKAQSMPEAQENPIITAKLNASLAITKLETNKYKQVAQLMTDIDFASFTNAHYEDVVAPNDIAIYGGLCALATFNRRDLKSKVLDSTNFRQYLELEPQIRELILAFYYADYEKCMTLMDQWRNDFLLDLYLHSHVNTLYSQIQHALLVQYVKPFQRVSLARMVTAFGSHYTLESLEKELVYLISADVLNARIDDEEKVLTTYQPDIRYQLYDKAVKIAETYEAQTRAMLVCMKLAKINLAS